MRIYDFGTTEDGTLFLVMEYLQGRSLERVLAEQGALPAERVAHIVNQIAGSLTEAHGHGIVHRDLKPDNILLLDSHAGQRDVVKLLDFGIAKGQPTPENKGKTTLTVVGAFVGTPAYMSPEQFGGSGVGPRSDLYSLGVTTYQMLKGQLPFSANTAREWAEAHSNTAPPALESEHGAGPIPESMRQAVMRALAKNPAERQSSVSEFAKELSSTESPPRNEAPHEQVKQPVVTAPPAQGGMKTSPMTQLPEFGAGGAERVVATTRPMAAAAPRPAPDPLQGAARAAEPWRAPPQRRRLGLIWSALVVSAVLAATFSFLAISGRGLEWFSSFGRPREEPPPIVALPEPAVVVPSAVEPTPSEPITPATPPTPSPERPRTPAPPSPATPPITPPSQPPAPVPTLPPGSTPQLPPIPGVTPTTPGTPPAIPTTPLPTPTPGLPAALPGLPQLPWGTATSGACERCLEELRGSGHYTVMLAAAQGLLCNDPSGRQRCDQQIAEAAPQVAEQAARARDCPSAWATMAAGMNAGVPRDRFQTVDTLCPH